MRRGLGFVWRGGEIFAILAEVEERVAELAVERDLIPADEFDAGDVIDFGRRAGVLPWLVGRFVDRLGLWGLVTEGLPGFDETEVLIFGTVGIEGVEDGVLDAHLCVDERGFEADEAGLAPLDAGELVDEGFFGVVDGFVGGAGIFDVEFEGGFVFADEDYVDDGGKTVD